MKTKKVLAFTLLFSALSMVVMFAQGPRPQFTPEQRAKNMTEQMKKQLNLTDEQASKLEAVNLKFVQDQMKARETSKDVRADMRACYEKHNAALKEILTPEQFKTWQESRRAMMNRMRPNEGQNGQPMSEQ
ncbi:MAG: hypothetical protein ACP5F6_00625 [Microbacter sp.]